MCLEIRVAACLITMATLVTLASSEIFTSSLKVERMVLEEEQVLAELKRYIEMEYEKLKVFSNFYADRLRDVRLRQSSEVTSQLKHPNAVYNVIKKFALDYSNALGESFETFRKSMSNTFVPFLADQEDVQGAKLSLLRLQNVYNIKAINMAKGDYLGFVGPQLSHVDAYEIGKVAFTDGKLNQSIDWLNTSLALLAAKELHNKEQFQQRPTEGAIKGLMGRVYQFMGKGHLAQAMYDEAKALVIYNVLSDQEGDQLKNHVKNKLRRGLVGHSENATVSRVRTSDLSWIWDKDSPIASSLSKRIECITGLDTSDRLPDGPSSAEALQIVNYGLGGHYEVHMDPFEMQTDTPELKDSGERIATFLIYLSDVQRGGSTVFTRAGISVAPVKNMALLWYNFDPAHQRDELTHHAGCPVLIGHKWIANKWIWTYGNTFRRRCGLTPSATQLDIEPDMKRGYK